ncbi:hypothetical protein MMC29_000694 [Sticta canariensis]|nr:hypothetical protein [Sticta canariensis]
MDPLAATDSQTPLGEPMSSLSGFLLPKSPVKWHLNYWLNIAVVAALRGEDKALLAIRVEREFRNIANVETRKSVQQAWVSFYQTNSVVYELNWLHKTLASSEAQVYLRDIDRMLVNKGQKTRDYLHNVVLHLIDMEQKILDEVARRQLKIDQVYRKLEEEEIVDQTIALRLNGGNDRGRKTSEAIEITPAEAANRLDGANDVHDNGEEIPAATKVEHASNDATSVDGELPPSEVSDEA